MEDGCATTPSPQPLLAAASASGGAAADGFQQPIGAARLLGRNVNGTVVQTSMPQNEAELQLYRVMQRASLLSYYDTLLEMGGDDVQQLCDAGEEEFLEIMALVGMASKPLHVRRLQKALQEWLTNPAIFQTPVLPGSASCSAAKATPVAFPALDSAGARQMSNLSAATLGSQKLHLASSAAAAMPASVQLLGSHFSGCCPRRNSSLSPPPASVQETAPALPRSPGIMTAANYESSSCGSQGTTPSPGSAMPESPTTFLQSTPVLLESQVQRLAEAAEKLAATIRPLNPKPQSGIKKRICKNLEMVMAMPDGDPRRMDEIRKYAAIYGRFDCKRRPEKPLSLHEVSVNEAAAQICRFVPALLTRRDELFPLARRVVRDSGHYSYTKALLHSSCNTSPRTMSSRENGDGGELSGGDESLALTADLLKRRKLEDDNKDNSVESQQLQADTARLRCSNYSRSAILDPDSNSMRIHANRHRKRQRRRRPSRMEHKSMLRNVWHACGDNSNMVLDGVVGGLDDSDGCYSSFDDDWDDCNDEHDCGNNFGVDSEEAALDDGEQDLSASASAMQDIQHRIIAEEDDASCLVDKENDFNLKVIASCGDNIIAVANPALMGRNQPTAITKEQPLKEEIALRDRRD